MAKQLLNNIFLISGFIIFKINTILSCTQVRVVSHIPELEHLNGDYLLDPTIIADGRPVYISTTVDEDDVQRKIYHYSYFEREDNEENNEEENNEEDEENLEIHGRWIIGDNIYNNHGWAFLPSWCIDPSDKTMYSYVSTSHYLGETLSDEQHNLLLQKLNWRAFFEDEWSLISDELQIECHSKYSSHHSNWDWLFLTTKNIFSHDMSVSGINHRTVHGFFYRIDNNIWRKVESNLFLIREKMFFNLYNLTSHLNKTLTSNEKINITEALQETSINHINVNQTLLQQLLSLFDITTVDNLDKITVYSIIEYNGYTNDQGLPLFEFINESPIRLTTMVVGDEISSMELLSNAKWHVLDINELLSNSSVNISKSILHSTLNDITILHPDENDEESTIYDVFRNYYKQIKTDSFTNAISSTIQSKILSNDEIKDRLINTENNNENFPYLMAGLGTGGLNDYEENRNIITTSIANGYRKFDSASAYHSEEPLGDILTENKNITRDELFITTKLWPTDHGYFETYQSVLSSLDNLRTNYIDLYLIHWPHCFDELDWMDCTEASKKDYVETWERMQKLYAEGVLLNIGVSNFDFDQFTDLIFSPNAQIIPHVVQNYFDIVNQDWEFVEYLKNLGVVFEGYATYRGIAESEERKEEEPHYYEWLQHLTEIANTKTSNGNHTHISPSQVLLRWLVESKISVIPRTRSVKHLNENWNFWDFELTDDDVSMIHTRVHETNLLKEDL